MGLAEVSIRLIREKARATKAGMRAKFGYLPPNQFNMEDMDKTPYEMFSNNQPDYMRDFRVEWGEPVVDKKPKGISSELKVTGQWAIVVRRIMNGSGVLKVYLIQKNVMLTACISLELWHQNGCKRIFKGSQ